MGDLDPMNPPWIYHWLERRIKECGLKNVLNAKYFIYTDTKSNIMYDWSKCQNAYFWNIRSIVEIKIDHNNNNNTGNKMVKDKIVYFKPLTRNTVKTKTLITIW